MRKNLYLGITVAIGISISSCASIPTAPSEPLITVQLQGSAVEVQQFIEDRFRSNPSLGFQVDSANDRKIRIRADCVKMPAMTGLRCAGIMMLVGNSGWDGPFAVFGFSTAEIRGVVTLSMTSEWCATNVYGRENCIKNGTNAEINTALRDIERAFNSRRAY